MVETRNLTSANQTGEGNELVKPDKMTRNTILITMGVFIFLGNILVCLLFASYRCLRTVTNIFVVSLAISDIFMAVILLPSFVLYNNYGIVPWLVAFILFANLSNLLAVTYDRYEAILKPLTYRIVVTRIKVYKLLVVVWTIPLILALIPLSWYWEEQNLSALASKIYSGLLAISVIVISLVVSWVYFLIFRVTRRQVKMTTELEMHMMAIKSSQNHENEESEPENSQKHFRSFSRKLSVNLSVEIKAAKTFAILGFLFAICWYPLVVLNTLYVLGSEEYNIPWFDDMVNYLLFSNSLINPAIYSLYKADFRKVVKRLVWGKR